MFRQVQRNFGLDDKSSISNHSRLEDELIRSTEADVPILVDGDFGTDFNFAELPTAILSPFPLFLDDRFQPFLRKADTKLAC